MTHAEYVIELWESTDEAGLMCEGCEHCERTRDAYGTGDSPTLRECTVADPKDCYGVMENYDVEEVTE